MSRFAMFAIVLLSVAGASAQTATAPIPKAFEPLQGTWVMSGPGGEAMMPDGELALVITGADYAQTINGQVTERGTITLDATKKPMTIDLIIKEGDDAGKTQLGLIEVTGDTLKGALAMPGAAERPTSFEAGQAAVAFVGKRKAK